MSDRMKRKKANAGKILYMIFFLVLCVIPSAGLLICGPGRSGENAPAQPFPSIRSDDGGVNVEYLQQAGDWYQGHFAFRQELVTANAKLRAALFQESAADGVIMGTDGWLYYKDSLPDYQGTDLLPDRALYDIAHTAAMTQEYCRLLGIGYLFALAPDKATVYPEHMPYYYRHHASDQSNRTRLASFMEAEGVSWLDLEKRLTEAKQKGEARALSELYHHRDSHWNAEGAAIAADAILTKLGTEHTDYSKEKYQVRKDFEGDLERMLYPAAVEPEEEVYCDPAPAYGYVDEVESTFDFYIHTVSGGAGQSLVMYRDSFANALLPFMAASYGTAYFTRGTPYKMTDLYECGASDAVFLRAERFLPEIAATVPVLEAFPTSAMTLAEAEETLTETAALVTCAPEDANPYYARIEGVLEEAPRTGERIFAAPGDGNLYEAMPLHRADGKEGFVLYLPQEKADETVHADQTKVFLQGPDTAG